jgi:hypothetical protein
MSPFGPKHPISETSWRRGAAAAFFVLVVVFGLLLDRAEDQTDEVNKRVTKVESPCLKYGAKSEQCERAFEAAVSTITHPQACAIERKAGTLQAIRELAAELDVRFSEPCAGARIAQERQRGNEREATSRERRGDLDEGSDEGAASAPGGGAGVAPEPGNQDDSELQQPTKPGKPRHEPPSVPGNSGSGGGTAPASPVPSQPPPGAPSSVPPSPPADTPGKGPPQRVVEGVGKAAGEVVDKVGGAANDAVEGVSNAGCKLAGRC